MIIHNIPFSEEYLHEANNIVLKGNNVRPNVGHPFGVEGIYVESNYKSALGTIVDRGVKECVSLYKGEYSDIWIDSWVNVVKPHYSITKTSRHSHVDIQEAFGKPIPNYTWIYYIQLPNNTQGDEGALKVELNSETSKIYHPKVGQLVILGGDMYHTIFPAPNSTLDRIVLAGNVSFMNKKVKKSLI